MISAVGHETDFTICDFAADLRAPTPSAAAELAVSDRAEQHAYINQLGRRCASALDSHIRFGCNEIKRICAELSAYGPMRQIISQRQTLDSLFSDMQSAALQAHHGDKLNLSVLAGRLDALSPLRILSGGYAAVERGGKADIKNECPQRGRRYNRDCGGYKAHRPRHFICRKRRNRQWLRKLMKIQSKDLKI